MPTESDEDRLVRDLFEANLLTKFKMALWLHTALAQAFRERTGEELRPESDFTLEDIRRACRIMQANGRPQL